MKQQPLEDAPLVKSTAQPDMFAAETSQLNLTNDEIWRRFKKAQQELNKLMKEAGNENKHRN